MQKLDKHLEQLTVKELTEINPRQAYWTNSLPLMCLS